MVHEWKSIFSGMTQSRINEVVLLLNSKGLQNNTAPMKFQRSYFKLQCKFKICNQSQNQGKKKNNLRTAVSYIFSSDVAYVRYC